MKNNSNRTMFGYFAASMITVFQGIESLIFSLFGLFFSASKIMNTTPFAVAVSGIKEVFTLVLTLLTTNMNVYKSIWKKRKTREFKKYFFSAVFTSAGNLSFFLAISTAGSSYGVILTALYPVFSILIFNYVSKEKEKPIIWFGIGLTFFNSMLFFLLPVVLVDSVDFELSYLVGMVFSVLAALFWAIEGTFIKSAIESKDPQFIPLEVSTLRNIIVPIITVFFLMPFMSIFGNPYIYFSQIIVNWVPLLVGFGLALNIYVLRKFHILAFKYLGAKKSTIISSTYFVIPATLGLMFLAGANLLGVDGNKIWESTEVAWWTFILFIPLFTGIWITIYFKIN